MTTERLGYKCYTFADFPSIPGDPGPDKTARSLGAKVYKTGEKVPGQPLTILVWP